MTILRIFGAVILSLSGIAAAYVLNSAAKKGLSQTEAFISFLRFLRSEIECFSMPVPRAITRCPSELREECGCAAEVSDLRGFLQECTVFDSEAVSLMGRFCDDVGKGYRDEQLALCDYYISLLDEHRRTLAESLPSRRKRNSALCLAGALALVIVLI